MLFYFYKIHDFRFLGDHSIIPPPSKKAQSKAQNDSALFRRENPVLLSIQDSSRDQLL